MLSRTRAVRVALIVSMVSLAATPTRAQTDRGTITGVVVDSSGGVVAGASVKAIHVGTNFERTVTTSPQGTYTIPQLPVGAYVVIITADRLPDHHAREHRGDGWAARCAWTRTLAVGGLQDAVTVTADSTADSDRQRQGDDRNQQQVHPGSAARGRRGSCDRRSTSA